MLVICHSLFRCVRIGDVLHTITIQDVYEPDGTLKGRIVFVEEKKKRKLCIANNYIWNITARVRVMDKFELYV